MKFLLILVLSLSALSGFSQSFIHPIPKPIDYSNKEKVTTALPDSSFTGFRPVVSAAVYGYTKAQGSALFTGAGVSYENDSWNNTTKKWYTNWSVGALFYAGGTSAPTGLSGVIATGLNVSFFNKLLSVGGAYNFEAKTFMPTLGVSISLNN